MLYCLSQMVTVEVGSKALALRKKEEKEKKPSAVSSDHSLLPIKASSSGDVHAGLCLVALCTVRRVDISPSESHLRRVRRP